MKLHPPFRIGSRLLPALHIEDAWLSLEHTGRDEDGRDVYRWHIDITSEDGKQQSFSDADLRTGCRGGKYQETFRSLLGFLGACGESYAYELRTGRTSENRSLFPAPVAEWAYQNSEEISMMLMEIETANLIEE